MDVLEECVLEEAMDLSRFTANFERGGYSDLSEHFLCVLMLKRLKILKDRCDKLQEKKCAKTV